MDVVYKYKYTSNSALPKYTTHIVEKGFKEDQGVDFDEIFSPVIKMTTLRMMLALVAKNDFDLFQIYVKTIFWHGDRDEEIYMEQPKAKKPNWTETELCPLLLIIYRRYIVPIFRSVD